jgi:hypothetical protein
MKIDRVFFQGKYAIHSPFLDTTLQAEGILEEGETMEQEMDKLRDRLNVLADKYRNSSGFHQSSLINRGLQDPNPELIPKPSKPKEINLQSEVVEIINDCETLEQLAKFKDRCSTPALVAIYMDKLKELSK